MYDEIPTHSLKVFDLPSADFSKQMALDSCLQAIIPASQPKTVPISKIKACRFWNRIEMKMMKHKNFRKEESPRESTEFEKGKDRDLQHLQREGEETWTERGGLTS